MTSKYYNTIEVRTQKKNNININEINNVKPTGRMNDIERERRRDTSQNKN